MYQFKLHDPHFLPHSGCDIQFDLKKGEGIVIAGENGLGKTTLLHRFYNEYANQSVIVEQKSLDYFYDRTVFEVKEILFEARGKDLDQNIFMHLYQELGLVEKESRRLSTLSGGENQSLKLICALSQNVPLYFLDEPSQFLDARRKTVLNQFLNNLKDDDKTVLIVEHDMSWLNSGWRILQLESINNSVKEGRVWTI